MSEDPQLKSVRDYLLYSLSLPERALRTTTCVAGGAIRESAALLVPQAFQDSKTYSILVGETRKFLTVWQTSAVEHFPRRERSAVSSIVT